MKFYAVALALAGLAFAAEPNLGQAPTEFMVPDGIDLSADVLPMSAPPADHIAMWHPPHGDIVIDDCDDTDSRWHWVKPSKPPKKPKKPDHQWTTSTITKTSTKTVISCKPIATGCPGPKTVYTTITIPKTTTICPVPIPTGHPPPHPPKKTTVHPHPSKPTAVPKPTKPSMPPKSTKATSVTMITPKPIPTSVGTVTKVTPTTTSVAVVTAAAAHNAQRAGGALAAMALAAAALV